MAVEGVTLALGDGQRAAELLDAICTLLRRRLLPVALRTTASVTQHDCHLMSPPLARHRGRPLGLVGGKRHARQILAVCPT